MNRSFLFLTLLLVILSLSYSASAQDISKIRFTTSDGLPSNHVYSTIQDRNGYIWIATDKGVARYNGYSFKTFTTDDGLPSNDVWRLFEDSRGRIWLFSHATRIGYLEHDKYHSIPLKDQQEIVKIKEIVDMDGLIMIHYFGDDNTPQLATFANHATTSIGNSRLVSLWNASFIVLDYPYIWNISNSNSIQQYSLSQSYHLPFKSCDMSYDVLNYLVATSVRIPYRSYCYFFAQNAQRLRAFDINTCSFSDIDLNGEDIRVLGRERDRLLAITNKHIYAVRGTSIHRLHSLDDLTEADVNWYHNDTRQNIWVSTASNGLLLLRQENHWKKFIQPENTLLNAVYKGTFKGHTYWWDEKKSELLVLKDREIQQKFLLTGHGGLHSMAPYNDKFILSFSTGTFSLNSAGLFAPLKDMADSFVTTNDLVHDDSITTLLTNESDLLGFGVSSKLHALNDSVLLFLSPSDPLRVGVGRTIESEGIHSYWFTGAVKVLNSHHLLFNKTSLAISNMADNAVSFRLDKLQARSMSEIINMISDSVKNLNLPAIKTFTVAVSRNKRMLSLFMENSRDFNILRANNLRLLGISQIENILSDGNGNIFVQDVDKIICYNIPHNCGRVLTPGYTLQGATMHISNNRLTVVGVHGITTYEIHHNGTLTQLGEMLNFKGRNFTEIQGSAINPEGNLLLSTDSGLVCIPIDLIGRQRTGFTKPKFNLFLREPVRQRLGNNDTIILNQLETMLRVDAVNFAGTEDVTFSYRLPEGIWKQSNSGEILLEGIEPGKYYSLTIVVRDKHWYSKPIELHFWQTPYWYQTSTWKTIFWIAGLLLFAGSLYLVAVVTRRRVAATNEQRRQQTEMELRAIHSQINPHFIFNTLSTALYFMKTEQTKQAYEHVDKFSKLLRAYLRSSRERWTTLEEDILILDQYIQLQRTRLQHGLQYTIDIDPALNPKQILMPSLLLQPLIENAIHHGLFNKDGEGTLSISFKQDEEHELICIIEDDGIGREKAKALKQHQQEERKSYGSEMTADLIQTLKKYEQVDIKLKYIDKQPPETGTIVIISFKKMKKAYS